MSIFAAGTALYGGLDSLGVTDKIGGFFGGLFGDDTVDGPCPGQPSNAQIDRVRRYAPAHELAPVRIHWEARAGRPPFATASASTIGKWLTGGDDCKHSGEDGKRIQAIFSDLVARYGNAPAPAYTPAVTTYQTASTAAGGGSGLTAGISETLGKVTGNPVALLVAVVVVGLVLYAVVRQA